MDQRYLLVCSITTGRQFPERKNSRLIIEGKFKDEILESDPVPLHSSPQINTGSFGFIGYDRRVKIKLLRFFEDSSFF